MCRMHGADAYFVKLKISHVFRLHFIQISYFGSSLMFMFMILSLCTHSYAVIATKQNWIKYKQRKFSLQSLIRSILFSAIIHCILWATVFTLEFLIHINNNKYKSLCINIFPCVQWQCEWILFIVTACPSTIQLHTILLV